LSFTNGNASKIEAGIAVADRCEFATEDELTQIASKYSPPE